MKHAIKLLGMAIAVAAPVSQAHAERIFGLTQGAMPSIVTFDSTNLGVTTSSGLIAGLGSDTLTGLDLRPSTRVLYSVGTSGSVYRIDKNTVGRGYTAVSVGTATTPSGAGFGLDFNPVPDRIRLISDTGQNLRINPNNGVTANDAAINFTGGNVDIIGAAYSRNRPGLMTTTLYAFDAAGDTLLRSTAPNAGTFVNTNLAGVAFGPFGFNISVSNNFGFDISGGTGTAFVQNNNQFGTVSLVTGQATLLGAIGAGNLVDITAASVPEPASWALMIGGFGLVGSAMRRRAASAVTA